MRRTGIAALALLAACEPQAMVDKAVARTAESVIAQISGPEAARCIVDNASPQELAAIARDIGVEAGTSTLASIANIAARPAAAACIGQSQIAQ